MSSLALQFEQVSKVFRKSSYGVAGKQSWQQGLFESEKHSLFTALQDINLDIHRGEIWGVIGHNGAGKSTMLKLAARILRPSSGVIRGYGRVTGILEVGAGFNYQLTGRENIYLSGYMLGMTKAEVAARMDDIIDFAGIGSFIDSPIKRYSTGMFLRLAFAVAAFLRTDIMVIDEVLAVGDAAFQQQCLGRINDNASQIGTTVLFVSHNMGAIRQICTKAILLDHGRQQLTGNCESVVQVYSNQFREQQLRSEWNDLATAPGNDMVRITMVSLEPHLREGIDEPDTRTPLTFHTRLYCYASHMDLNLGLHLFSAAGELIFDAPSTVVKAREGWMEARCEIPGNFLNDGAYTISLIVVKNQSGELWYLEKALAFELSDFRDNKVWTDKWKGA